MPKPQVTVQHQVERAIALGGGSIMAWESINVRDHGAIGDGIADDTAAIQTALRQACHVHIPAGRYRISQIKIPPECRVTGDGCNQTWLFPFGEQPGPLVTDQGNAQKIMIEHIGISGQHLVRDGLIKLGFGTSPWGTQGVIYSCQIRDCPTGYGIYIDQNISLVERSYILKCKTGLYVKGNEFVMNHVQMVRNDRHHLPVHFEKLGD